MNDKPEGPIWIDLTNSLINDLTMAQVVRVANLAMNRLTMRDWGEIFHDVGIQPELNFKDNPDELDQTTTSAIKEPTGIRMACKKQRSR